MIDIVFSGQNEEEFVKIVERLGYTGLCFFYRELKQVHKANLEKMQAKTKVKLYTASSDPRQILESRSIDMVFGMESSNERDSMIQKKSGLNHILCAIAKEKNKMVGF